MNLYDLLTLLTIKFMKDIMFTKERLFKQFAIKNIYYALDSLNYSPMQYIMERDLFAKIEQILKHIILKHFGLRKS